MASSAEKALRVDVSNLLTPPNHLDPKSPGRNPDFKPIPLRAPTRTSIDLDDYFRGPRNMYHHSKLPYFFRLHGSILPKMILPLTSLGLWATLITCISKFVYPLAVDSVLLTILGFLVGLGLSFRCSTAYERYAEGRKYWAELMVTSRNLARLIWIHAGERHEEGEALGKTDLLAKLTALNLINAFAVALKHRLRFEPAANYPDLGPLVDNIQTMAGFADQTPLQPKRVSSLKATGSYLGISFAESNPRTLLKHTKENLGNIPLEILTYLSAYMDTIFNNNTMTQGVFQAQAMGGIATMTDILTGVERVLNTPLPLAYCISIAQITWVYIVMLPFQLFNSLGWITIPATMVAAYIILGISTIGYEIENPFGQDVNDLPLDTYCRELAADIDVLTSMPAPQAEDFISTAQNKVLFPLSMSNYEAWSTRSVQEIREALTSKATTTAIDIKAQRIRSRLPSPADSPVHTEVV